MDSSDAPSLNADKTTAIPQARISTVFESILSHYPEDRIAVGTLVTHFSHSGFGFLIILFAALPALPIPAQGIATLLSIPLCLLFGQIFVGRTSPWIPAWIARKTFARRTLVTLSQALLPYLKKFEYISRPRFFYMTSPAGKKAIAIMGIVCALLIAIPIPFTNTIPSIGILIMALGMIERDGLAVKAGMCIGALGFVIISLIILSADDMLVTIQELFT
jgi:hypothetical protein